MGSSLRRLSPGLLPWSCLVLLCARLAGLRLLLLTLLCASLTSLRLLLALRLLPLARLLHLLLMPQGVGLAHAFGVAPVAGRGVPVSAATVFRRASPEFSGALGGGDIRPSVIHGSAKFAVRTCELHVPRLIRGHLEVMFVHGRLFAGGGACVYAVLAAVEAHAVKARAMVDNMLVVDVADHAYFHARHRAVVVEGTAAPVAAEKANAGVAEAVVNAAIEAHGGSPVAGIP